MLSVLVEPDVAATLNCQYSLFGGKKVMTFFSSVTAVAGDEIECSA